MHIANMALDRPAQCGPPGDLLRDQVMAAKDLVGVLQTGVEHI